MATVLAFVVLAGGSAYAAGQLGKNSVGAKQLKKNAVSTAKIKNGAVTAAKIRNGTITGAKIDLPSLGTVPSATSATTAGTAATAGSAKTAVNAGDADTVNGRTVTKVFARIAKGGKVTIGSFGFVTISAECAANGNFPLLEVKPTRADTDIVGASTGNAGGSFDQGSAADAVDLNKGNGVANARGVATFSAATATGAVVSGVLGFDNANTFVNEPICAVYGEVTF